MDIFGIVFGLFGLVFALVGLYFLFQAVRGIVRAVVSRNWMPVEGRVVKSDVDHNLAASTTTAQPSYAASIEYEYEVRGTVMTGTNVNFSKFRQMTPAEAARIARKYPVGATVTVYHNQWQPERSVLEPGKIGPQIGGLIVGLAVTLFGLGFGVAGFRGFDTVISALGNGFGIDEEFAWDYFVPFAMLLGLLVAIFGVVRATRSIRAKRWPTVDGTVTGSGIVRHIRDTNTSTVVRNSVYKPEIVYEYRVNDQLFVSNRLKMSDISSTNRAAAEATQARYPVGATVKVFHDPGNPELAVLDPGGSGGAWLPIVVGLGFIVIGLILRTFHSIVAQ